MICCLRTRARKSIELYLRVVASIVCGAFVFGPCYGCAVPSVLSSFHIISLEKREMVALLMSCDCLCSVSLPHGAEGWSAA